MELRINPGHFRSMRGTAWSLACLIFFQSFCPLMLSARDAHPFSPTAQPLTAIPASHPIPADPEAGSVATEPAGSAPTEEQQTIDLAMPGGPDQPEVKSFTPLGTSDMVSPFTGDFSYNIPLMDVDGYPINLAYNAGITMDQEASWVGLGWNLNPGVVNRVMRGLPDDFNGSEKVVKDMNVKGNFTIGVSGALGFELFGVDNDILDGAGSITPKLGINWNNYNGFGAEVSLSAGMTIAKFGKSKLNAGLGFSGSSQGGATVTPSLSLSKKTEDEASRETTVKTLNVSSAFNSRGGFRQVSTQYSRTQETRGKVEYRKFSDNKGTVRTDPSGVTASSGRSFSSSFNTGMSTFTPSVSMPMRSAGGTFSFKMGGDIIGFDGSLELEGYFSKQWLRDNTKTSSAYGYMNLQNGQSNPDGMLDFNRENDGAFTEKTPALAVPSLTYDLFNASGQGMSGSYRAQRSDIGFVFDPEVTTDGIDASLGVEAGLGATFKGGIDVAANYSNSKSGMWDNAASDKMRFVSGPVYFREANEMSVAADVTHFDRIGGGAPVRFNNNSSSSIQNILEYGNDVHLATQDNYKRLGRDKRNQVIYTLNYGEMASHFGIEDLHPNAYVGSDHHLAQFTTLNDDGTRYVYGIAAYNIEQKDVSFAMASSDVPNYTTGLVDYDGTDASTGNSNGRDNYFNRVTTPAYAHSFLLTSVLNADYVDADNIKGPSAGDIGGYVKLNYKKVNNYQWRTPVESGKASFDEGMNTDGRDNKAHYTYGKKELWYVKEIVTKNHIAVFHSSADRHDGHGVNGETGGVSSGNPAMLKLDSIQLFSLPDYNNNGPTGAVPIQTVHFEYDYSLCPNYPQNTVAGEGKLTLTRVYTTYEKSRKGRYTPYVFHYGQNKAYNAKSADRWGTYKPQPAGWTSVEGSPLRPSDFPYTGFDKANVDQWSAAWCMNAIDLPSGGRIEVDYESDDYRYVQHKRANQMLRIIGVELYGSSTPETTGTVSVSNDDLKNARLYFELVPGCTNINDYIGGLDMVYFRALMKIVDGGYDYVPGYASIQRDGSNNPIAGIDVVNNRGWIQLAPAKLKDNGPADYNPIAVAGIQFARIHLASMIPGSSQTTVDDGAGIAEFANALVGAFASFGELITGPNIPLWNDHVGTDLVIGKSWLRLNNPDGKKLGGGHRVKEIRMYDAWDEMSGYTADEYYYGQRYSYLDENGFSSGVAAYEPQLGGDENPWRTPIANDTRVLLAPDTRNYQETPFGEQFFPSPMVGYSRVTVQDIPRAGVERTATGKVVHEFYTAKEFPTIVSRTSPQVEHMKLPIFAFFFQMCIDELSASQGFVVETNDMHGKPKSVLTYAQNQPTPITKVEYFYQSVAESMDGMPTRHLTNTATVIEKNGTVSQKTVGLNYEAVADFRKSTSMSAGGSINFNTNFTIPFVLVPTIMGSGSFERTAFRSATFTKVIERFGLLINTKATDLGSEVETNTLAYDAETGVPLLTQTTTNFNDKVYNFTYPAHWYYDGMGQAYRSIDIAMNFPSGSYANFAGGVSTQMNKSNGFFPGDEIAYVNSANMTGIGWVTEVNDNSIKVLLKNGDPLNGLIRRVKVLRSGRRNMQNTSVGSITLQTNPLNNLTGNVFDQVLQAGAVEYAEEWRTFCECFTGTAAMSTNNPYVLGLLGNWRNKAAYTHLSARTQTFDNNNSNIRRDGQFVSFRPFYKLQNGSWIVDKQNWTYDASVTEVSPSGQPLETVDALDRYSASQFSFNQTLPTAVSSNTRYNELGFDSFEDYDFANCIDNHFHLGSSANIVTTQSHTGRSSIAIVGTSTPAFTVKLNTNCEPQLCTVALNGSASNSTTYVATISGGTAPYGIDYEIISGITNVVPNDGGTNLTITHNATTWKIRVIITDAEGCVVIQEFGNN